jgi:putative endonuclease
MQERIFYVYILASERNGTLYVGFTGNLEVRTASHKFKLFNGFTKKYNINKLVYYEQHNDISVAKQREKSLKKWRRNWKLDLIEKFNPEWNDLFEN